jgi:hypothetical protein
MSLVNVYGDDVLDVWDAAFGTVWLGVEVVAIPPVRYHTLIGPALTRHEIIGPSAGYTAIVGPSSKLNVLEG